MREGRVILLDDFSTYRSVLMGISIIIIMASHTLGAYAAWGIIGVEWFLVLSAIGSYYSLKNGGKIVNYYKRRLIRILPAYLVVAVPFFLIRYPSTTINDFLIRVSGLNLFLWGERFFWFVTLILICYLLAPLYYRFIDSYRYSFIVPFLLAIVAFLTSGFFQKAEILVTRIPIFLLGMNLASHIYDKEIISDSRKVVWSYIIAVVSLFFLLVIYIDNRGIDLVRFVYFIFGIPSLFFALSVFKGIGIFNGVLSFMGGISYELYLIHQHIALSICKLLLVPKAVVVILSYAIAIVLAYLLHLAICATVNLIQSRIITN